MRLPLSWLCDHVAWDVPRGELIRVLTAAGLEIESVAEVGRDVSGVIAARVLEVSPHPDAERLAVVNVDSGDAGISQVVCGAHNYRPGDIVAFAAPGAVLPGDVRIARRRLRGVWSDGMLAAPSELGAFSDEGGILLLPATTPLGSSVAEAVGLRDTVLDVKVFPNRGDTASIRGIAREVAIALGVSLLPLRWNLAEHGPEVATLASVTVDDVVGCRHYVGRVVEGVEATRPSPLWLARRLHLVGMRSLGAVVDVTNFLLWDQGQPLHAFDLDRVPGSGIVVRRARGGERIVTLDGQERILDERDTLITAGAEPLAIAGILGGRGSQVDGATRRVLVESAYFPPEGVASTMARLGLATESGQRWAKGVDPELAAGVADRAAAMIAELAGGVVARGRLQAGPGVDARPEVTLDWKRSSVRLGAPPEAEFAAGLLESVGCKVRRAAGDALVATPPSWRSDLESWADLEEEVARRWGYDHIPATLPSRGTPGGLTSVQRLEREVRSLLAGLGVDEMLTWPFTTFEDDAVFGVVDTGPTAPPLRVSNPLSAQQAALRTTVLPGLLSVARRNLEAGKPGVSIYEIGRVFHATGERTGSRHALNEHAPGARLPDGGEAGLAQPVHLGLVLAGRTAPARFDDPDTTQDFFHLKGLLEALTAGLGLNVQWRPTARSGWHPGRSADLWLVETWLGTAGQVHPQAAQRFGVPDLTLCAELALAPVLHAAVGARSVAMPSSYPALAFDLAFLVPKEVSAATVHDRVAAAAGSALRSCVLFDVYEGDPLPEGQRNLAWRLTLQAGDRTLSDEDGAEVRKRVEEAVAETGATLRAIN